MFLLRPDEVTNSIFEYCLGYAAWRHNIGLIDWQLMSNHYHLIAHDRDGTMPAFIETLHKFMAKVMNARFRRMENFWSSEEPCLTYLPTPADVFERTIQTLLNPVAASLVASIDDWTGSSSYRMTSAGIRSKVVKRPPFYFKRKNSTMPDEIVLEIAELPEHYREALGEAGLESDTRWRERVVAEVMSRTAMLATERAMNDESVIGMNQVLATSLSDRPSRVFPKPRPAVESQDRNRYMEERAKLFNFHVQYDHARKAFIKGQRDIEFPAGTYRLRSFNVLCEPNPPIKQSADSKRGRVTWNAIDPTDVA